VDDLDPDRYAVGTGNLIAQFEWLKEHGYRTVSVDEILEARAGRRRLPEKSVLLTFDDGLASTYTRVFPLLKLFGYSAVMGVVGAWLELPGGETVLYGNVPRSRRDFLIWEQAREMVESGLVEIASHSFNLHRGVEGNPQGNMQPAGVTRIYDRSRGTYETLNEYRKRISEDLERNVSLIESKVGRRPRVVVWPYGTYNQLTEDIAREMGAVLSLGLKPGMNDLSSTRALTGLKRAVIKGNPDLVSFVDELRRPVVTSPVRVAHVDLDYVFDPDEIQQEANLSVLMDRIRAFHITTVYLQAFADEDGDGTASQLYFPNRHLPVRADLFNRVAWQLRTRAEVSVFGWLPVLAYDLEDKDLARRLRVEELVEGERRVSRGFYRRLSPYKEEARRIIGEIYEDLAASSHIDGILFHDDAYLGEREDAAAVDQKDVAELPNPRQKSEALCELTDELAGRVRRYRPEIETARNIYAGVIIDPESEVWFSQNLTLFLEHYDQTAVMAMPYMEESSSPLKWLDELVRAVAVVPGALEKTVFELQAVNWKTREQIPSEQIREQMKRLQYGGGLNVGYYPDDFLADHPVLEVIRPAFSASTYPHRRRD
jgi:biofilm PGA synthesis lipoprotein PgaB